MATDLSALTNGVLKTLKFSPNMPSVLEFDIYGTALPLQEEVWFNDGNIKFYGWINSRTYNFSQGGFYSYTALDRYSLLTLNTLALKTNNVSNINPTAKIGANTKTGKGFLSPNPDYFKSDLRTVVKRFLTASGIPFSSANVDAAIPSGVEINTIAQGRATGDDWLVTLLTESGYQELFAYIDGMDGSVPSLGEFRFALGGSKTLDNIISGSLSEKAHEPNIGILNIEGAGEFRRYENTFYDPAFPGVSANSFLLQHPNPPDLLNNWAIARYRMFPSYPPGSNDSFPRITSKMILNNAITDSLEFRLTLTNYPSPGVNSDIVWNLSGGSVLNQPSINGKLFARAFDDYIELDFPYSFMWARWLSSPWIPGNAKYTAMTKPLRLTRTGVSGSNAEKTEIYQDFFKYTDVGGSVIVNPATEFSNFADARAAEIIAAYSADNASGSIVVYLEEINPDDLGKTISSIYSQINGKRIGGISYDLQGRRATISVSALTPKSIADQKIDIRIRREAQTDNFGWYQRTIPAFVSENLAGAFADVIHPETGE